MTIAMWSSGTGPGWLGSVVVALVVVALWVVPIAGTLALFPNAARRRRRG